VLTRVVAAMSVKDHSDHSIHAVRPARKGQRATIRQGFFNRLLSSLVMVTGYRLPTANRLQPHKCIGFDKGDIPFPQWPGKTGRRAIVHRSGIK